MGAARGARWRGPSYEELVETEGRPRLRYWLDRLSTDGILAHAAVVYGYFPAVSEGDDVVVLTEPRPRSRPRRFRFTFPRQQRDRFLCIADFIRSRELASERGQVDVLPFQLVTMGQPIADFANELFASNSYRDYLEVHGIGVQLTEALAEYWHKRVREELKFPDHVMAAEDPDSVEDYFKLGYRGARFSFGYGACPNLEDRTKMVELLQPDRIGVDPVRGAAAPPRAVHGRVRAAPPRGEVLQHLSQLNSSAFCAAHWATEAAGLPVSSATGRWPLRMINGSSSWARYQPRSGQDRWNAATASALSHCS